MVNRKPAMSETPLSNPSGTAEVEFYPAGISWHYLNTDGRTWLEQLSAGKLRAQPVKTSVRRWVCRFPPGIYVKQIHYRGLRALGKSLSGGNACREGAKFLQLARLGVFVPEVLGFGSERHRGLLKRDVLITKEVVATQSLLEFMQQTYPTLEPHVKWELAADLARYIGHLHDQGVIQRDLHINNLLLRMRATRTEFVLLDAQRVMIQTRSLTSSQRLMNLAVLLCNFWSLASTTQCLRFLRDYGLDCRARKDRWRLRTIKSYALKLSRRSWDAHARQAITGNGQFVTEHRQGFQIHRIRRDDLEQILDWLLAHLERIFGQGEVAGRGRIIEAAPVEIEGRQYFLKRYRCQGWGHRLWEVVRRRRAQHTWLNSWAIRLRHLPVPEPLLCLEMRGLGLSNRSYLLTEFIPDARSLRAVWDELGEDQRRDVLIRTAIVLGRLHRYGGAHGAFSWDNLLVAFEEGRPKLTMTALDNSRMMPNASRAQRIKDLARFLRALAERDPDGHYGKMFIDAWRRWSL
jgi:tRNA A-37 threonylcarbamoyl transferase component Bud32